MEVLRSPASTGGGWTGWGESCVAWWTLPEGGHTGGEGQEVVRKAWAIWADEVRRAMRRSSECRLGHNVTMALHRVCLYAMS